MKIGIQTGGIFEQIGVEKGFETIAAAGFDCIDLNLDAMLGLQWNEMREGKPSEFFFNKEIYERYAEEIIAASKKTGVTVGQAHAPFPLHMRGCEEANRNGLEYAKVCIRICQMCGCKKLIIHPSFEGSMRLNPSSKEEEWEVNIAFYRELIPLLKECGVICCLENMWGQNWKTKKIYMGICSDMGETNRYIDTLNELAGEPLFGFCLDIGHLTLLGLDCYPAIKTLGNRLVTLHIHDNDGAGDEHEMPFTGVTIWNRFIRGLAEIGYEGTLSFESAESQRKVPVELLPAVLSYTAQIGRYFDKKITELKEAK